MRVGDQIAAAYRRMAIEARYRPAAPSDGLGNVTLPLEELDIDAEAQRYVADWWTQENAGSFAVGCANYPLRPAMIFALEAARLCCSTEDAVPFARRLLELALEELSA